MKAKDICSNTWNEKDRRTWVMIAHLLMSMAWSTEVSCRTLLHTLLRVDRISIAVICHLNNKLDYRMMGLHIQPVNPYYYHYHKTSCNPYYFYTYSFFTLLAYMTANICPESFSTFFTSSASCFSSASSFLLASADPESVAESFAPLKERPTDRVIHTYTIQVYPHLCSSTSFRRFSRSLFTWLAR